MVMNAESLATVKVKNLAAIFLIIYNPILITPALGVPFRFTFHFSYWNIDIKRILLAEKVSITKTTSVFRLLTETNATDVTGLASEFGMRSGVSRSLWPSSNL